MTRCIYLAISILAFVLAAGAQSSNPVSVASNGWTATADGGQGVLTVSRDNLGVVMEGVRLNLRGPHGLLALKSWSAEKRAENQIFIETANPPTGWLFELDTNELKISSTVSDAVLIAQAPAPPDRIVARLLDPQGVPVDWEGTQGIERHFGGHQTRNPSFLPARNPECMYFALGQVSSLNLHSLFDRKTDTALSFPSQARMQRDPRDGDLLDLTLPVPGNALVRVYPDYFTKMLGVPRYARFDDSYFSAAPAVWGSWPSYYGGITEADIVRNADWLAAHLKPYGFDDVELDEGYDGGKKGRDFEGENHWWIGPWDPETFPHGPQWLAHHIKSEGLGAGLWLVPNAYAGAVQTHPDWYLRDKEGKFIPDYSTPSLDSTNPQVLEFLKKLFTTLDDWGFDYFKLDGEFSIPAYASIVDPSRLYDPAIDPVTAYINRVKLIRETIGPRRFIEGCPEGTPLNAIGYFTSYFNGQDGYNSWEGMHALFSSISANSFLNHLLVYVMPGEGMDVEPPMTADQAAERRTSGVVTRVRTAEDLKMGFGTTQAEARTLVSYVALSGVVYSVASIMPELPAQRVELLKMTLPPLPILPIDLFSRGSDPTWDTFKHTQPDFYIHNYPEILDLKVNGKPGVYDVAGLTNWRSWQMTRELDFSDKLGLDTDSPYVVFDFWNQKLLGVFKNRMTVEIEPHDTRVLLIHPLLNRPQLVGTSRHITGAYSIAGLAWDSPNSRLHGVSETVSGDDYTLWLYVPEGFSVAQVRATLSGKREIAARHELKGNSLKLTFSGQGEPVDWEVRFLGHAHE
jgi:alpha-galactosidase